MEADVQASNLGDSDRYMVPVTKGQPLQEERQKWVVGFKCLWNLRGEVWAVALGLRDRWEWCLQSQEFAQGRYIGPGQTVGAFWEGVLKLA